jgi:glycopeptide antibiotics resistance protein
VRNLHLGPELLPVNLEPGVEIERFLNLADRGVGLLNLVGNIAMFVPVGFFAVSGLRRGVVAATNLGLVFSGCVEIVQYGLARPMAPSGR